MQMGVNVVVTCQEVAEEGFAAESQIARCIVSVEGIQGKSSVEGKVEAWLLRVSSVMELLAHSWEPGRQLLETSRSSAVATKR